MLDSFPKTHISLSQLLVRLNRRVLRIWGKGPPKDRSAKRSNAKETQAKETQAKRLDAQKSFLSKCVRPFLSDVLDLSNGNRA
jgi:hypothetical protein